MTLEPNRVYSLADIEPEESPYRLPGGAYCHHPTFWREAAEGKLFGLAYLVERCKGCGREWPTRPLSPERQAQFRRAQASASS